MLLPLHRCAMYNHTAVVKYILNESHGADTSLRDAVKAALDYSRMYNHKETTACLERWETVLSQVVKGGGIGKK